MKREREAGLRVRGERESDGGENAEREERMSPWVKLAMKLTVRGSIILLRGFRSFRIFNGTFLL